MAIHEYDSFDDWENTPPKESLIMQFMKSGRIFEVGEMKYPSRSFFFRFDRDNLSLLLIRNKQAIPIINQVDVMIAFDRDEKDVEIHLSTHERPNYLVIERPVLYM